MIINDRKSGVGVELDARDGGPWNLNCLRMEVRTQKGESQWAYPRIMAYRF